MFKSSTGRFSFISYLYIIFNQLKNWYFWISLSICMCLYIYMWGIVDSCAIVEIHQLGLSSLSGCGCFLVLQIPFSSFWGYGWSSSQIHLWFHCQGIGFCFFFFFFSFFSLPSVWLLRKVGKGNANKILNLGVSRVVVSCPKNRIFRGFWFLCLFSMFDHCSVMENSYMFFLRIWSFC